MDDRPDFKLDAYLVKQGQRGPLCDVCVWLGGLKSEVQHRWLIFNEW